jgi:hypothetical protein
MHGPNCLRTVCKSPLRKIAFQGFIKGNFAWISSKLLIALVSIGEKGCWVNLCSCVTSTSVALYIQMRTSM